MSGPGLIPPPGSPSRRGPLDRSPESLLAGIVRDWALGVLPQETAAADGAVRVAMRSYAAGASVSESCREARKFLGSWSRHPSREHVLNPGHFAWRPPTASSLN